MVQMTGPLGQTPSARSATEKSLVLFGPKSRRETLMLWGAAMVDPRISTLARAPRRRSRPDHMALMVMLSSLPPEEPRTITCVRFNLSRTKHSIMATLRLLRVNTTVEGRQVLGRTGNRHQDLLGNTDILHSPKGRSMVKVLRHKGRRGDTGVVVRLRPNRADILARDTGRAGSNTRQVPTDSLRLAKADGVAIRRGIESHHSNWDGSMLASVLLRMRKEWTRKSAGKGRKGKGFLAAG